jgi:AsmA protein
VFEVRGRFRGAALDGQGRGGGALAWRDASKPYPLELRATLGDTQIRAEGTVTGLRLWTAADLHLRVQGENLAALYGVSGVLLPPTPPFQTEGRLVRAEGLWRYESFTGQIGHSTVVGTLQFRGKSSSNGGRPALTGELRFDELDLADLKPAVGARGPEAPSAAASAEAGRALPDLPLDTRHWADLDADVSLQARSLVRGRELNLHDLKTRVVLKEARLSLDPLVFAWAGGQAQGQLSLDASRQPLQGQVAMRVRGLSLRTALAPIWPASAAGGKGLGKLDADAELQGQGASVGRMLASAKGHLSLRAQGGEVSRLMMEASGLHLLEILRLKLAGDQTVAMNCAVAVFDVDQGLMRSRTLVFDTSVNSLQGSGTISLAQEQLDLTIVPRTKVNSLVALRSPVHIIGTFRKPEVRLDIPRIAARSAGAVALGLLNPLLALVPLFEAGPGVSNDCHRLLTNARAAGVPAKS